MKAIFNDKTIAESKETVMVEGNDYFPPNSVDQSSLQASSHRTFCHWKGEAYYYNVTVNGETVKNGAWYYPSPKDEAKHIASYVAFYPKIKVTK